MSPRAGGDPDDPVSVFFAPLLLGLGGGLRSFAVPAVLGLQDRGVFPGPGRFIALGAAVGELIADKSDQMSSRWALRGLSLRLGFSASAGYQSAGIDGAVAAGLAALASARAGSALRARAPSRRVALAEDALSYTLVLAGALSSAS